MSINAHLSELERRHTELERQIASLKNHPSSDQLEFAELKRKKLRLKDEMAKLSASRSVQ